MLNFSIWKKIFIVLSLAFGLFFFLPNVSSLPGKKLNFGLDLRGGSHVLLGIDQSTLTVEHLSSFWADARNSLKAANIGFTSQPPQYEAESAQGSFEISFQNKADLARAISTLKKTLDLNRSGFVLKPTGLKLSVIFPTKEVEKLTQAAAVQSVEILRRRIDALGTREPVIQAYGKNRIVVEVPGLDNPEELVGLLGKMAKLNFHLVSLHASGRPGPDDEVLTMKSGQEDGEIPVVVRKQPAVDGSSLIEARAGFDQDGKPSVFVRFNAKGARIFANITRRHLGQPLAIVLDKEVLSTPVLSSVITNGSAQISGHFTLAEATNLALLLRAGALPAPLKILGQHTVGSNLGADAIRSGTIASLAGLAFIVVFMVVAYGTFGMLANVSLVANLVLMIAVLSLLQATLTLPGIAGIVLTLGMAVDANVLVFERIREEIRLKKSPLACIEAGYSKAFITILDSNLTTLIAAFILFIMGSGPVRGFAVTLTVGIVTSLFTAYTLNRFLVAMWFHYRRPKELII